MAGENSLIAVNVSDYKLVHGNLNGINSLIADALNEGFVPYGQPFNSSGWICQAMVKVS